MDNPPKKNRTSLFGGAERASIFQTVPAGQRQSSSWAVESAATTSNSTTMSSSNTTRRSSLGKLESLRSLRNSATATALAAAQRLDSFSPELRQAYERVVLKKDQPEQQHVEEDFYININMKGEPSESHHTDAEETSFSSGTDYDDQSIKVVKMVEDTTSRNEEEQEQKDDEEQTFIHRVDSSYGADVDEDDSVVDDSSCESKNEQQEHGALRCSSAPSCPAAYIMIAKEVRRTSEVVIVEEEANTMSNASAPTPTTTTTPPYTDAAIESQPEKPVLPTHGDEPVKEETEEEVASTTDERAEETFQTDENVSLEEDTSEEEAPHFREPPGILATQEACWVDEPSTGYYSKDESSQSSFFSEDEEENDDDMSVDELVSPQQTNFSDLQGAPCSDDIDTDAAVESSQQPGGVKLSDDDASSAVAAKIGYSVDYPDEASGLYPTEDALSVELNYDNNGDHNGEAAGLVAVMLKDSVTKEDLAATVPCHDDVEAKTEKSKSSVIKRTENETTSGNSAARPQPKKAKAGDKDERKSSPAPKAKSTAVKRRDKPRKLKKEAAIKPEKNEPVQERSKSSPKSNKTKRSPVAFGESVRMSKSEKTRPVKEGGPVDLDVSWHSHSSETTECILNDQQEDRLLEEYAASVAAAAKIEEQKKRKTLESITPPATETTNHTAESSKKSETRERSVAILESSVETTIQKAKPSKKSETRERSIPKVASTGEASIPKTEPPLPSEFETREQQLNDSLLRGMPLEAVLMRRFDLKFQESASLVADARIHMGGGSPSWEPWTNELYEECEKLYKLKFCGGDENEEEKVIIMNWPKFLAPVDGLRAPTDADFASSSGNSANSAASSCLESSTGWSSVWDENDGDFSVVTHDREDEYSVGVIQELKQNCHEPEGVEIFETVTATKSSKAKSTEARHSKKSKSKSRSNHSKSKAENPKKLVRKSSSIMMGDTGDLGIMPPTTIQDDEASKEFSDISNMSENILIEKPPKLSDEKERYGRKADATSVKSLQKAHPSEAAFVKSKQKPTTVTPPSPINRKTPEQAVPVTKTHAPRKKQGLFSMLRCCATNDAVVVQPTNSAD